MSAGGLRRDEASLCRTSENYLFPIENLARVFRAKVVEQLWQAYHAGELVGFDEFEDPEGFSRLINRMPKSWYTYAKPSFKRGEHVLQYLGRYTHRVGLANSRLLDVQKDAVTFRTRGSDDLTLHPVEFLRRFVMHVLPSGFHKIRHYGLNASSVKREAARQLLGLPSPACATNTWHERLRVLTGRDINRWPRCDCPLEQQAIPRSLSPRPVRRCRAPPSFLDAMAHAW